jgi:hypothetical protein
MKKYLALFIGIAMMIFAYSCSKQQQKPGTGIYTGTFTVEYSNGNSFGGNDTETGAVTLELKSMSKYDCSANSDRYPAGGSGKYCVGKDKITFTDECMHTADFDWNLILSGEYNYTCDGKNLKIWANKNGVGKYSYELIKE